MLSEQDHTEIRSKLEYLDSECIDANAGLQKPTDQDDIKRCFSIALDGDEPFCRYQQGTVKVPYISEKTGLPDHMRYYRCTYNGGR